jgi:hypothetical protein
METLRKLEFHGELDDCHRKRESFLELTLLATKFWNCRAKLLM